MCGAPQRVFPRLSAGSIRAAPLGFPAGSEISGANRPETPSDATARSCRSDDARQFEQTRPKPGDPYQRHWVTRTQPQTVRHLTEKKVLDFKLAPRLEQVGDENANQLEEIEHRILMMPDSVSTPEAEWIEFSGTTGRASPTYSATWSGHRRASPDSVAHSRQLLSTANTDFENGA
jgi:hypothetical protein